MCVLRTHVTALPAFLFVVTSVLLLCFTLGMGLTVCIPMLVPLGVKWAFLWVKAFITVWFFGGDFSCFGAHVTVFAGFNQLLCDRSLRAQYVIILMGMRLFCGAWIFGCSRRLWPSFMFVSVVCCCLAHS